MGPSQMELRGYRDFVQIARSRVSEVYRAVQIGIERSVAVKVLLLDDAEAVARFQRELEITVELGRQHPHIVSVIDTGVSAAGRPCIVMEFYENGSLYDRLREQGPLPWDEVLAAGVAVADALAFAHQHGVLHRDLKPQNIFILPTSYVVADFGISRRIGASDTSSAGWFSFRHAAPQVLNGDAPTVADDIWSLGSTLHVLLDGRSPFAGDSEEEDSAQAYMSRVRTSRPKPLVRPDVPSGLIAVIDRCLRYDPSDRFGVAESVLDALKEVAADQQALNLPPPQPRPVHAPSALAYLKPQGGRAPAKDLMTSMAPDAAGPASAPERVSGATVSPRRRILLFALVGVMIGGLLAVGASLLSGTFRHTPTSFPTSTLVEEPSIAPVITRLEVSGSGAYLEWQDPSQGQAGFVVVRLTGSVSALIGQTTPGTTTLRIERLDPVAPPYCFLVMAVAGNQRGVSEMRCAAMPPTL